MIEVLIDKGLRRVYEMRPFHGGRVEGAQQFAHLWLDLVDIAAQHGYTVRQIVPWEDSYLALAEQTGRVG